VIDERAEDLVSKSSIKDKKDFAGSCVVVSNGKERQGHSQAYKSLEESKPVERLPEELKP